MQEMLDEERVVRARHCVQDLNPMPPSWAFLKAPPSPRFPPKRHDPLTGGSASAVFCYRCRTEFCLARHIARFATSVEMKLSVDLKH